MLCGVCRSRSRQLSLVSTLGETVRPMSKMMAETVRPMSKMMARNKHDIKYGWWRFSTGNSDYISEITMVIF